MIHRSAELSADGQYRYRLDRWWGAGPRIVWVMLNPSTADAEVDDPTIRRVMRFTADWGYQGCTVLNLWPYRTSKPSELAEHFGKDHDESRPDWSAHFENQTKYLEPLLAVAPMRVAAWGAWPRSKRILTGDILLEFHGPFHHLGLTKDGSPRHPLYVRAETAPQLVEVQAQ